MIIYNHITHIYMDITQNVILNLKSKALLVSFNVKNRFLTSSLSRLFIDSKAQEILQGSLGKKPANGTVP